MRVGRELAGGIVIQELVERRYCLVELLAAHQGVGSAISVGLTRLCRPTTGAGGCTRTNCQATSFGTRG